MHGEVGVALPIPLLGIGEPRVTNDLPVDLFLFSEWKWSQRLGQQLYSIDANCRFSRLRAEERSMHPDDVAEIEMGEQ